MFGLLLLVSAVLAGLGLVNLAGMGLVAAWVVREHVCWGWAMMRSAHDGERSTVSR